MAVTWALTIGGSSYLLESLNVVGLTITRRNLATSEMRIACEVESIYAEPIMSYGVAVRLYRNGVCWFAGTVTDTPASGEPGSERQEYVISDSWWKLERVIYQQPYVFRSADFTKFLGGYTSHVVLGNDAWGNKLTASAVISAITTFAGVASATLVSSPTSPVLMEARDISCAEAIKRILSMTPDCVGYMDYSTGVGVLYIKKRAVLDAVSYALDNSDQNKKLTGIASLTPRNDLLVAGVVIVFLTTETDADGATWLQEERQTAGTTSGEGVVFATIDLSAQGTEQPETAPAGLASAFYASSNVLQWQGSLALKELECTRAIYLGSYVNLTGGRSAWASMNAVVQTTTEDIMNGLTNIELGPPEHLGLADFVDLMSPFRNLPNPSPYPSNQNNGTEGVPVVDGGVGSDPDLPPVPNPDAGTPAPPGVFSYMDIEYCRDGVSRIARVVGTDAGPA
jgi:hypothetical protein